MKFSRRIVVTFALICFVLLAGEAQADQEDADQQQNEVEDGQNEYGYQQQAEEDYKSFSVCDEALIVVEDMQVTCDSPGSYYYGSNKYRNSETCLPGDKAKIQIDFYIEDYDTIEEVGGKVYVTIQGLSNGGRSSRSVYKNAELCELSTLKSLSGSQCPENGEYRISTHFFWDESNNNANAFYPKLVVGFKSDMSKSGYDLGGANTNKCALSPFADWSDGVKSSYATALATFMKTFGILVCTIFVMVFVIWCLLRRQNIVMKVMKLKMTKVPSTDSQEKGEMAQNEEDKGVGEISFMDEEQKIQKWHDDMRKIRLLAQKDVLDF